VKMRTVDTEINLWGCGKYQIFKSVAYSKFKPIDVGFR